MREVEDICRYFVSSVTFGRIVKSEMGMGGTLDERMKERAGFCWQGGVE